MGYYPVKISPVDDFCSHVLQIPVMFRSSLQIRPWNMTKKKSEKEIKAEQRRTKKDKRLVKHSPEFFTFFVLPFSEVYILGGGGGYDLITFPGKI